MRGTQKRENNPMHSRRDFSGMGHVTRDKCLTRRGKTAAPRNPPRGWHLAFQIRLHARLDARSPRQEGSMADDKTKRGGADRALIALTERYDEEGCQAQEGGLSPSKMMRLSCPAHD